MREAGSEQVQPGSRSHLFLMLAGKRYNTCGQGLLAPGSLGDLAGAESGRGGCWGGTGDRHLLRVLSPCSPTTSTRVFYGSSPLTCNGELCTCKRMRNVALVTDRSITEQRASDWLSGAWMWTRTSPQRNTGYMLTEGSDHIVPPGFILFLMVFTVD